MTPVTYTPCLGQEEGQDPLVNRKSPQTISQPRTRQSSGPCPQMTTVQIPPGYKRGPHWRLTLSGLFGAAELWSDSLPLDQWHHLRKLPRIESPHLRLIEWLFLLDITLSEPLTVPPCPWASDFFPLGTLEWEGPFWSECMHAVIVIFMHCQVVIVSLTGISNLQFVKCYPSIDWFWINSASHCSVIWFLFQM